MNNPVIIIVAKILKFDHEKINHTGLIDRKDRIKRNLAGPYTYDGVSIFYQFTANATEISSAPASLDWTLKGFSKAVDNQGTCGLIIHKHNI